MEIFGKFLNLCFGKREEAGHLADSEPVVCLEEHKPVPARQSPVSAVPQGATPHTPGGEPCQDEALESTSGVLPLGDCFLEAQLQDFLAQDPPCKALLFDPEEEECQVYYFREGFMKRANSFAVSRWEETKRLLKAANFKTIILPSGLFMAGVMLSFSNFGERVSLVLEPHSSTAGAALKEGMKGCIRLVNSLKPATSLTELNKLHLSEFVESNRARAGTNLVDELAKEELLSDELRGECEMQSRESGQSLESLIIQKGVFPRKLLTNVVAQWAGFEYLDIDEVKIDLQAAALFELEFCRFHRLLPYRLGESEIFVVVAYPGSQAPVVKIESLSGRKAVLLMSAEEDIRNRTADTYRRLMECQGAS